MNDTIEVKKIFTPSSPAIQNFVEREDEVNDQIIDALYTTGKQIVVYGHSGSGKTTLITNKLKQIYEHHITVRCMKTSTYDTIILQAFDELNPYYKETTSTKSSNDYNLKLANDYKLIKAEIALAKKNEESTVLKRLIPPSLTMQTLARFLGNAKCCLVLEDFHKIPNDEKIAISQTMKLFMDMSDEFDELKIICIGAVDTGREVIAYDKEMSNRVSEILVPLMTKNEIHSIIKNGFEKLNIEIPEKITKQIINFSNGVPSICHEICLKLCLVKKIYVKCKEKEILTEEDFKNAINKYIKDSSDTIKSDFDKALEQKRKRTYNNTEQILKVLSTFDIMGATHSDILKKIQQKEPNYPQSNLTKYLGFLTTADYGGLIVKRISNYSFKSPIYLTYTQLIFKEDTKVVSFSTLLELLKLNLKNDII